MQINNCLCGRAPELVPAQAYTFIRCDECDKQEFNLDANKAVRQWNQLVAPVDPIEFFVQQAGVM